MLGVSSNLVTDGIFFTTSGITTAGYVSYDKCDKNKCTLLFAEEIAFDTTKHQFGHENPVRIFTDSKSNMRLFRVGHADFKTPYETEIIDVNLQCSLGLVDVFLQDTCIDSANYRLSYKECVRRRIDSHANGTMNCTYRCYPMFNSNTTFVRFAKVKYITGDDNKWVLNAILTRGIN